MTRTVVQKKDGSRREQSGFISLGFLHYKVTQGHREQLVLQKIAYIWKIVPALECSRYKTCRQRIPVPAAIMPMPSNADIRMPKMNKMNEMNKKEAFAGEKL